MSQKFPLLSKVRERIFSGTFLGTGAACHGGLGLFAERDFREIRGLVLLLFFAVINPMAGCCPKISSNGKIIAVRNLDVVTSRG